MSAVQRPPRPVARPPVATRPPVSRWAYVLIVIGALSLFDVLGLDRWGTPLIMLVVGVALLTRHQPWGRTLALLLTSAVLVVIGGWYFVRPAGALAPGPQNITLPVTAARAEIQLVTTVGRLNIGPTSSDRLIDAALDLDRNDRLDRTVTTRGGTQVVRLAARQIWRGPFNFGALHAGTVHWLVRLSPTVPLTLRIETGVGPSTLDLGSLRVADLSLAVGVGPSTVHLPATGVVAARIQGGVGSVRVTIPGGMQARVRATGGLGTVKVLGDFQRDGDVYTSSGYVGASNRVDLNIDGGVGAITVEQTRH
jgi:hypothetical protein